MGIETRQFTGAVAAVQAAYQFSNVVPLKFIGAVILRSVIIELGPVLTALVVGGRVGASIAAELGTMKVTEQIDALRAMAINPVRYLVVPRVVAAFIDIPPGNLAMYYPEANVLVPIGSTEPLSNCPTYKHVIISLRPAAAAPPAVRRRSGRGLL